MYLILFRRFKLLYSGHKTFRLILLLSLCISVFVLAMVYFEKLTPWQSLYFSVVTGTTIGYGEITPKTVPGQLTVMVFIFIALALVGEAVTSFANTISETLNKKKRGLVKMKKNVDLLIIGYPSRAKVEGIIDEFIASSKDNVNIVCLNNRLEEKPSWMDEKGINFIRGSASIRKVLEKANIANTDRVIILANEPENVDSDATTAAALIMCEKLNPTIMSIAERVGPDPDLFTVCSCDCIVPVSRANELAQEALHPGTIALVTDLTAAEGYLHQKNVILTPDVFGKVQELYGVNNVTWYDIARYFLNSNIIAIGYSDDSVSFVFNPNKNTEMYAGLYIKIIVNNAN